MPQVLSLRARRLLEPACGTGRLITELAGRGYQVTGFDISQPALSYLRRRLERRRLHADTFEAEMSDFRLGRSVDAAYCMVNTFRHLLTEQAARSHLKCIAGSLRPGGIYVLGMNLLPSGERARWTERRGKTKVTITQRVLRTDLRRRIEDVQVCLTARPDRRNFACGTNISCAPTREGNFDGCSLRFRRWNCATPMISGTTLTGHSSTMKSLTACWC